MMRTLGFILILFCAGGLAVKLKPLVPTPAPSPVVPAVTIPAELKAGLEKAFADKKSDAAKWSGMFDGLARYVAADGLKSPPLLRTTFDLLALRDSVVAAPIDGVAGGAEIGALISPCLDAIGKSGEPLDEVRRDKVIALFAGIAEVLRQ